MSDIYKDLALFNELVTILINEEEKKPVAERIDSSKLYDSIDLSLNDTAIIDDDFKTVLTDVLVATPKTATNLFFNQLRHLLTIVARIDSGTLVSRGLNLFCWPHINW